jgi:hypothetical protein
VTNEKRLLGKAKKKRRREKKMRSELVVCLCGEKRSVEKS